MLSIIVCCYRNPEEARRTLESIARQGDHGQEVVIVDGGSGPEMVEMLRAGGDVVISEPDDGLYNAMNKGLRAAGGAFVLYLNAGDWFADDTALATITERIAAEPGRDIHIFRARVLSEELAPLYVRPHRQGRRASFSHQAVVVRRSLHLAYPFNEQMAVSGDVDVWRRMRRDGVFDPARHDEIVSIFTLGGRSSDMRHNTERFIETLWSRYQCGERIGAGTFLRLFLLSLAGSVLGRSTRLRHAWYRLRNRLVS